MLLSILLVIASAIGGFLYGSWRGSRIERDMLYAIYAGRTLIYGVDKSVKAYYLDNNKIMAAPVDLFEEKDDLTKTSN